MNDKIPNANNYTCKLNNKVLNANGKTCNVNSEIFNLPKIHQN